MTVYGGRGKGLEKAVRALFDAYASRGVHCQQNHPEQLHDGTLVKRHGFDFQILCRGRFYAFLQFFQDKQKKHKMDGGPGKQHNTIHSDAGRTGRRCYTQLL